MIANEGGARKKGEKRKNEGTTRKGYNTKRELGSQKIREGKDRGKEKLFPGSKQPESVRKGKSGGRN